MGAGPEETTRSTALPGSTAAFASAVGDWLTTEQEFALVGLSMVNRRAELLSFDASVDSAYDRYAFIRNAWLQRREYQVKDGDVPDDIPADEFPAGELEDPAPEEDAAPPADAPPAEAGPPPDQPAGVSSSATSLIRASEDTAGGRFR